MKNIVLLLLTGCLFFCCDLNKTSSKSNPTTPEDPFNSLNFSLLANKLIDQADLQPNERVLLVMMPGRFDPMVTELQKAIKARDAKYLGTVSVSEEQPAPWTTEFTQTCIGKTAEELSEIFEEVDLGIMLPGATPNHLPYKVYQDMLEEGIRRTIHFHWAGAYDLNGNLLDNDTHIDEFYQRVVLETDYEQLASAQTRFESAMRGKEIHVATPAGTDIRFRIGDRPVTKQDGNASAVRAQNGQNLIDREIEIPSGAIRVAPIEESVNGYIAFPDAKWNGTDANRVKVRIRNGEINGIVAHDGLTAVQTEIHEAGEAGKSFREFAMGFNPLMPVQTEPYDWIPYYGYGAGVVRLSLGDNTELGGKVSGGYVRWNFFPDATVKIGDEIWVEDGKLVYKGGMR